MFVHPEFDPVAIHLGPLSVHWYGLMYLAGFVGAWWLLLHRAGSTTAQWTRQEVGDLVFYAVIGVILGGRLGYVLFYNPAYYFSHPLEVFYVWTGGMSFPGIGRSGLEWCRRHHLGGTRQHPMVLAHPLTGGFISWWLYRCPPRHSTRQPLD